VPNLVAVILVGIVFYLLLNQDRARGDSVTSRVGTVTAIPDQSLLLATVDKKLDDLATVVRVSMQPSMIVSRTHLPDLDTLFEGAVSVGILATSGLGLINHHYGLFQDLLSRNIDLNVILLDPDVPEAMTIWDRQSNPPMRDPAQDIRQGINLFQQLESNGRRCNVLLTDVVAPFSLICAFDDKNGGQIQAEYMLFQEATDRRPHVIANSEDESPWFALYRSQFEKCLRHAEEYSARAPGTGSRDTASPPTDPPDTRTPPA
jgi:hypothetical protein